MAHVHGPECGHRHPANILRHDQADLGGRAADRVAAFMGSWRFIGIQTGVIVVWIALNLLAFLGRWDPYPFILLNLLFSTQAAYAAPILQLAQNRQTEHDRVKAEHDYDVNERSLELLVDMHALMRAQHVPIPTLPTHPDTAATDTADPPVGDGDAV